MSTLPATLLANNPKMDFIDLRRMGLTFIDPKFIANCPKVTNFLANENNLTSLDTGFFADKPIMDYM